MFGSARIIGRGRVGSAVAARLHERGVELRENDAELVLLCVPDTAISDVAASIDRGPWVAHTSGATSLAALAPHRARFSVHPLQTFTAGRGAEQLDGAWAATTAESDEARGHARELARTLGLEPFDLADGDRVLYHAGAALVSSYVVTLYRAARLLFETVGAPPEGLVPLLRRTIDNDFQMTGPIVRGDHATIEAHLRELAVRTPELAPLYRALARASTP